MSKNEALRREGERSAPIQPQTPPGEEKRQALDELAAERSNAVLDQLHEQTNERMGNRGIADMSAGNPGTSATAGNEANIGHPDIPGSEGSPPQR